MNCTMMLVGVSPFRRRVSRTRKDKCAKIGPRIRLPMILIAKVGAAFAKEKVAVDAAITAPR